jgi:putative transposase
LRRNHRGYGDTLSIDQVFISINAKRQYLWRGVEQDGEVIDVYLQVKRDGALVNRFFCRLSKRDKLRSYVVAHRELISETLHSAKVYENDRAEQSRESTRMSERGMRKFKSARQAKQFLVAHAAVSNVFNLGRHLIRTETFRHRREGAFSEWKRAVA